MRLLDWSQERNDSRVSALEDHVQREHYDLLSALQQAASASTAQEGERALQKDWAKRAKDDLRRSLLAKKNDR